MLTNVGRGQFEDLPDPHSSSGHQFQNQSVSRLEGPENYLIHHLLFESFPSRDAGDFVEFPHHGVIAGVLQGGIIVILDEIEEGAEVGIAGVLGELFISFCQLGEEREGFIGGQRGQFSIPEMLAEFGGGGVVGSEGIFLGNGVCGSRSNTGLLGRLS